MQKNITQTIEIVNYDTDNEKSFAFHLNKIKDYRGLKGRQHSLTPCLLIISWGFMSGYTSMREIARAAKAKDERYHIFTESLSLPHGVPSHDTLSRIMRDMDPDLLDDAFLNWMNAILADAGIHLAIDGKAVKASTDRKGGSRRPPYIINVVETTNKSKNITSLVIEEKRNEISSIPALIRALNEKFPQLIQGTTISIDALAMNPNTIEACNEANASLIAPVKNNQKEAKEQETRVIERAIDKLVHQEGTTQELEELDSRFSMAIQDENGFHPIDYDRPNPVNKPAKAHGRLERRIVATYVLGEDDVIDRFEDIKSITKVVRFREEIRDEGVERKYSVKTVIYHSTAPMDAMEAATTIADHWKVETYNYDLDVHMGEDYSTAIKKAAFSNCANMRRAALNLLKYLPALSAFESLKDQQAYCRENPDLVFSAICA